MTQQLVPPAAAPAPQHGEDSVAYRRGAGAGVTRATWRTVQLIGAARTPPLARVVVMVRGGVPPGAPAPGPPRPAHTHARPPTATL